METQFNRYECRDPCEILCEVPLPFEPASKISAYTYPPKISLGRSGDVIEIDSFIAIDSEVELALAEARRGTTGYDEKFDAFYAIYSLSAKPGSKVDWIGKSVFIDRGGVELASIQAAYNIIPAVLEDEQAQSGLNFHYFSIDGGPGSWIEYIQRYYPLSAGAGISNIERRDWNLIDANIDVESFEPVYDDEETGDIFRCWEWLAEYLPSAFTAFDLVFCHASAEDVAVGIATQTYVAMKNLAARSSAIIPASPQPPSFEEIEQNALSALINTDIKRSVLGGSIVIKVEDDLTTLSAAKAVYVLSSCFEWLTCFKPITSRPDLPVKYIICYNFIGKHEASDQINDLYNIATGEADKVAIRDDWPVFMDWLRHVNTELARQEIRALKKEKRTKKYDLSKLLLLLRLQGTTGFK